MDTRGSGNGLWEEYWRYTLTLRVSSATSTALQRASLMSSIHCSTDREGGDAASILPTHSLHLQTEHRSALQHHTERVSEATCVRGRQGGLRLIYLCPHVAPL